jgi:hypothetical protein
MKIAFWIFLILVANGCSSTPVFERGALVSLELRPRPGFKGLTNQRCVKWKEGKCIERDVKDFDLTIDEERLRLHAARFVCRVGDGPLFRICKTLHGLCQQTVEKTGWFTREIKLKEFLHIREKYQYLIDKGTYCISLDNELSDEL